MCSLEIGGIYGHTKRITTLPRAVLLLQTYDYTRKIIDDFAAQRPIRAGSFIITLYGDAIVPRDGELWMGDIIQFCNQVGISESLVRTAVSRLVTSKRLQGSKVGRKSYYRLTENSKVEFKNAANKIYSTHPDHQGIWTFLINFAQNKREDLKRKMDRIGFGDPLSGLFMKPGFCETELQFAVGNLLKENPNLCFSATLKDVADNLIDLNLLTRGWNLQSFSDQYEAFCNNFRNLHASIDDHKMLSISDQEQLLVRTIMVHEYRKIIIKDPRLPLDLLPKDWAGLKATEIFSDLYEALLSKSENFINQNFDTDGDKLAPNAPALNQRILDLKLL